MERNIFFKVILMSMEKQYVNLLAVDLCLANSSLHSTQPLPGFSLQIKFVLSPFMPWFYGADYHFGLILIVELKSVVHTATQQGTLQIEH